MIIEWELTDRANLVGFGGCLVAAVVLAAPLFAGEESLLLMMSVLVLLSQAWRMSVARRLQARMDEAGLSKALGPRRWQLSWAEVSAASLINFLGSTQLVVFTSTPAAWSVSDRLCGRVARTGRAIQVPADQVVAVRQLLSERGLVAA